MAAVRKTVRIDGADAGGGAGDKDGGLHAHEGRPISDKRYMIVII
jgi:hypothetical protein